nr:reverse transcriptase domain-containing protein [Tanacetum cinerariifolium]
MSTNEQTPLSQPTFAVRNTSGKEQDPQGLGKPASDTALREYYNRNYHKLLPIIAEKVHQEKVQQERLKAVKARLNFEETSQHSESGTPSRRTDLKKRLGSKHARGMSGSPESRRDRSKSPRKKDSKRRTMFKRLEKGVFHRLGDKGKKKQSLLSKNVITKEHPHVGRKRYRKAKVAQEDIGSQSQRGKSRVLRTTCPNQWVCKETNPFTPRIRYFDFLKTRMPSHIKTYDGSEDPEDHLKIFQAVAKTERWAMPTWCHMFNSTLTGNARVWFDDLPKEYIDSYDELKDALLEKYFQRKKCIKDPGAPECMKISGFMHGITNPELIKRLHDKILKSVDEIMRVTTTFLRGEVAASNRERNKSFSSWKQQEAGQKPNFKKASLRNQQRPKRKQGRFTILTKTPKEILALDKGKFKPPPPMKTPNQIEKMLKAGKLSHLIKELKQNNGKDHAKAAKKGETSGKKKPLAILMVKEIPKKGQNRIKTEQKREAWRSREKSKAVTVERGRKTKENKKGMNENANTSKKLFKFKEKKKRRAL